MKVMRNVLVFLVTVTCAHAGINSARGQVRFASSVVQSSMCEFVVETDAEKGISTIKIWTADSRRQLLYEYTSDPGEVFLESVRVERLSKASGDLLFVYWGRGASMTGLTVIGRREDGSVCPLFDDACRMGYQVIDIGEAEGREIVAVENRDSKGQFPVRIYGYTERRGIELIRRAKVKSPHLYAIVCE